MDIKLAIHRRPGGFSDQWIEYCNEHGVPYKTVDCYDSDIMRQMEDCDGLLWHWVFHEPADQLIARQIVFSLEMIGKRVFPDAATCWHYDDKIGQKYLLESVRAPLIRSNVFFSRREAMLWIEKTEFPMVFKLRCGAGSQNVRLVGTKEEARRLCRRAFGRGFYAISGYLSDARTKVRRISHVHNLIGKLQRLPAALYEGGMKRALLPRQKGYAYFQEYLPGNDYDTRITVVGNRAFGFTRNVRPGDFRASGSGDINYDIKKIDRRCLQIAFDVAQKLGTQSLAFDFIFDKKREPRIGEISYCYQDRAVYNCPGHWDHQLNWIEGHMWPEDGIITDLIKEISLRKNPPISQIKQCEDRLSGRCLKSAGSAYHGGSVG